MNRKLSKEIMKWSHMRKKVSSAKSDIDRKTYIKQHNYIVILLRDEKKNFYGKRGCSN